MRNLTKSLRKRRLNYKPTIGITLDNGKRVSVNSVVYWDIIRKEETAKQEAEMRALAHKLIQKFFPETLELLGITSGMDSWMYF